MQNTESTEFTRQSTDRGLLAQRLVVDRRFQDRHRSTASFCTLVCGDCWIRCDGDRAIRHSDGDCAPIDGWLYLC